MVKQRRRKPGKSSRKTSHTREWILAFAIALGVLIITRFFIFDIRSYSESGMEKGLLPGDILLVNKSTYGARLPMRLFPQSWGNLFSGADTLKPITQLPYRRFLPINNPGYNELVMLNIPAPHSQAIDKRTKVVKRLVGLPGDRIEIKRGEVWIGDRKLNEPETIQWNYEIELKRGFDIDSFIGAFEISEGTRLRGQQTYLFSFTQDEAQSLRQNENVRAIRRVSPANEPGFKSPFGKSALQWNADKMGPVTIPYKGFTVNFSEYPPDLYLYHILYHERENIEVRGDKVLMKGQPIENYTFKNDYYFFLGDNRHNTSDSRLWGMVPENHIIGKVSRVLFSYQKEGNFFNKLRKGRFFLKPEVPKGPY